MARDGGAHRRELWSPRAHRHRVGDGIWHAVDDIAHEIEHTTGVEICSLGKKNPVGLGDRRDHGIPTEAQRAQLEVAHRQATELGVLVDRLYEYAYLLDAEAEVAAEPVDVGVLVGECLLGMTGPIEQAGLEVRFAPPTGLVVSSDREKLTRIVQNLLRNAVQHGRGHLAVSTESADGGVSVQVSNGTAPGTRIDPARLFDRFYTADSSRSGRTSGLGLSIVRVLAEQLGGHVSAAQEGEVVTITVRVPR